MDPLIVDRRTRAAGRSSSFFRCGDGVILEVRRGPGEPTKIVESKLRSAMVGAQGLDATSVLLRKCFDGSPLDRAHAAASLSDSAIAILCAGPYGKTFARLRRIGRSITDPKVCAAVREDTLGTLDEVAREPTPSGQIGRARQLRAEGPRTSRGRYPSASAHVKTIPSESARPRLTIEDIARRARVSVATIWSVVAWEAERAKSRV